MVPIRIRIAQRGFPSQRAFNRASKTAHLEVGEFYHRELIPKHFRPGAEAEYRYRPRQRGYRDRRGSKASVVQRAIAAGKAVPAAATNPLTFTGALKRIVTQLAEIRGYPARSTVTMNLPAYAPARPRTSRNPPVAQEATRISGRERGIVAKVLADAMDREQAREYAKVNQRLN